MMLGLGRLMEPSKPEPLGPMAEADFIERLIAAHYCQPEPLGSEASALLGPAVIRRLLEGRKRWCWAEFSRWWNGREDGAYP